MAQCFVQSNKKKTHRVDRFVLYTFNSMTSKQKYLYSLIHTTYYIRYKLSLHLPSNIKPGNQIYTSFIQQKISLLCRCPDWCAFSAVI